MNVNHGQANEQRDYNVVKIHDFPPFNRGIEPQMSEYTGYLKKYKTEPIERRFCDFNFLIFVAQILGVETSVTMGMQIQAGQPHDS